MKRLIISLLFVSFIVFRLSAQDLMRHIDIAQYKAQVKLVDEFRARFNGIEKREDVLPNDSTRRLQLLLLCNGERYLSDSCFQARYNNFIETVLTHNTLLNYADSMWYAKALCDAEFNGKTVPLTIYLSVESRGTDMYKWVISDVEGEVLELGGYEENNELFLMPNQHEQNFMALSRATSEMNRYITLYVKNSYQLNRLDVFNTLVFYKLLKVKSVSKLTFKFMQVPKYTLTVEYFVRKSLNCGWLVSDVVDMSDADKQKILNKLHKQ